MKRPKNATAATAAAASSRPINDDTPPNNNNNKNRSALPTAALFGGDDDDDVDHISTPLSSTKNGDSHEEIGAANDENWNVSKPAPIIAVESPLAKPASVRPLHRSLDDELIALSWQNDDEPSVKIHQPQQQPQPQGWGTGPRRML